ncbi:hypothetical protein GGI12_003410 [Dipsacomyces acuminosporus]|nr:hypothetical protein GGI12_003410 [Dipsacomyces acuminosporus]
MALASSAWRPATLDPTDEGFDDYPASTAASSPSPKRAAGSAPPTQAAADLLASAHMKRELESLLGALESTVSPRMRAQLAVLLLANVPVEVLESAKRRLDMLMHRDFVGTLPMEVSTRILGYLSLRDITASVAIVSKRWHVVAYNQALWRILFVKQGWHLDMERWALHGSGTEALGSSARAHRNPISHKSSLQGQTTHAGAPDFVGYQTARPLFGSSLNSNPLSRVSSYTPQLTNHTAATRLPMINSQMMAMSISSSADSAYPQRSQGTVASVLTGEFTFSEPMPLITDCLAASPPPVSSSSSNCSSSSSNSNSSDEASGYGQRISSNSNSSDEASGYGQRMWKNAEQRQWQQPNTRHQNALASAANPSWGIRKARSLGKLQPKSYSALTSTKHVNWHQMFADHYKLCKNWRDGKCRIDRWESAHAESIYCVQFDRKNRLFTGSRDHSVKMWHLSGVNSEITLLHTLNGHTGSVLTLQVDGDALITGSSDGTACVWDLQSRAVTHRLHHQDSVLSLRFNDKWLATASKDRLVRVWRRDQGYETSFTLAGHNVAINAVHLCGDMLVSASGDRTIKVWDLTTRTCVLTFLDHTRGVACLDFDGKYIVSGSSDKSIRIWNVETGVCERAILNAHSDLVRTVMFDRKMDILVSGSYDEWVKVWSFSTGALMHKIKGVHTSRVFKLMFDRSRIVSCSHDHSVSIIDFAADIPAARMFC